MILLEPLQYGGAVASAAVRIMEAIVIQGGERFQVGTLSYAPPLANHLESASILDIRLLQLLGIHDNHVYRLYKIN